jgi:hypothetical protein
MIIKAISFIMFSCMIIAKPLYGDKQLTLMLETHCKMIDGFPNLLGIHIYKNKEGRILQLDIDIQSTNDNYAIKGIKAMSIVGQYSKSPFHKFIVIEHYPEPKIPAGFESNAECAINFFVKNKISESRWLKDCLSNSIIQRKIENWSKLNKITP